MSEPDDLDEVVRQADPDRWLAARFIADPAARADVVALYAFNHELARAAEVASQPLVGEIRLSWWREAVQEIAAGASLRRHPLVLALADGAARGRLDPARLEALADARLRDLDGWPLGEREAEAYADATAGALMAQAVLALAPDADPQATRQAGRAWGLAGLLRLGRLPPVWREREGRQRIDAALAAAHQELKRLPVAAFPAAGYATLARSYGRGGRPSELAKRARLTWAVLRGRL